MTTALKIVFRGEAPEKQAKKIEVIERRYHRLLRKHRGVISCRVVVDSPHRNRRTGNERRVSIDLKFPGGEAVARSVAPGTRGDRELFKAINEAFSLLEQQLHNAKRRKTATRRSSPPLLDPLAALSS